MKTAADIVLQIRKSRSLSMNELARLVGIPTSTISRIEAKKLEPTYSMLVRIVQSAGFSLDSQIRESGSDQPIADYLAQLRAEKRSLTTVSTRELLTIAALAPVSKRIGARRIEFDGSLEMIVNKLQEQGQKPIVSALEAYRGSIKTRQSFVPIIYVEDPGSIVGFNTATMRSSQVAFVISTTDNVRNCASKKSGVLMVDEDWGFLDALSSPGRQPDAALELLFGSNRIAV